MAPKITPAESLDTRKAELISLVSRLRGDEASDTPAVDRGDFEGLVTAAQEATERGTRVELRPSCRAAAGRVGRRAAAPGAGPLRRLPTLRRGHPTQAAAGRPPGHPLH